MPDSFAPRPEPFVQPYLVSSRSAKPFWPGLRERGASSSPSLFTSSCSFAKVASSSASVAGRSPGAAGNAYRTGGRDMVAVLEFWLVGAVDAGASSVGDGCDSCDGCEG